MNISGIEIKSISPGLWEIDRSGKMRVPARFFSSSEMIELYLRQDESLKQLINVASLPGIEKYALAMPDMHWGYGFPIGGVAAFDIDEGIISPGGVGYDINCGVRLLTTDIAVTDIKKKINNVIDEIFNSVPVGVGSSGAIAGLSSANLKKVMEKGALWAVENGFGKPEDLLFIEEKGRMKSASADVVSDKALKRGLNQLGTLGSGNHFLEIDRVESIFDPQAAALMGIKENAVVIMLHTGSRGFGYQICDDYLQRMGQVSRKYGIYLPDRQLACAPVNSEEGRAYYAAMSAAANFAWANRQVITALTERAFCKALNIKPSQLNLKVVYDVSHNIAKLEEHLSGKRIKKLMVHRKGATRSFGPGHPDIPEQYRSIGQPVLIPGDMGRYSYVTVGTDHAMKETFGSTCHGAGRTKSRKQALKMSKNINIFKEMDDAGIVLRAGNKNTVGEEMPYAYKDVSKVVEVMHSEDISRKVAKLRPLAVIKG